MRAVKTTALWCSGFGVGWLACFIMGVAGSKGLRLTSRKGRKLAEQYGALHEGVC